MGYSSDDRRIWTGTVQILRAVAETLGVCYTTAAKRLNGLAIRYQTLVQPAPLRRAPRWRS